MMIAHIPAGYLLTRRLAPRLAKNPARLRGLMALGLVAAVLPDFDLFYFYLIDQRQTLHHEYWTHIPTFWAVVALVVAGLFRLARAPIPAAAFVLIFANIFLHLALDTVAGGIAWAYPWDQTRFLAVTVPARFDWWGWNFVLHWTFLAEIAIVAWAAHEIGATSWLFGWKRAIGARILARRHGRRHENRRHDRGRDQCPPRQKNGEAQGGAR